MRLTSRKRRSPTASTLKQAALASGKVTEELFDETIVPLKMVGEGLAGA